MGHLAPQEVQGSSALRALFAFENIEYLKHVHSPN